MTTLVIDPADLSGDRLTVDGDSHRHLFRARRLGPGDRLRVVDGRGAARWAEVASVERFRASIELGEPAPDHEPTVRLDLLVATPRPERASWLVEKATEIGVRRVRFVASQRSPRRYGGSNLQRLARVARAAVEQCGRSWVPDVTYHPEWSEVAALLRDRRAWVLDPTAAAGLPDPLGGAGPVSLVVGPEGGFTADESAELGRLGCRAICLGSRVLRVETAAVVGAAAVLLRPRGC